MIKMTPSFHSQFPTSIVGSWQFCVHKYISSKNSILSGTKTEVYHCKKIVWGVEYILGSWLALQPAEKKYIWA